MLIIQNVDITPEELQEAITHIKNERARKSKVEQANEYIEIIKRAATELYLLGGDMSITGTGAYIRSGARITPHASRHQMIFYTHGIK
jgi:hypothetical protein